MKIENFNADLQLANEKELNPKKAFKNEIKAKELIPKRTTKSKTLQKKKGVFETLYYNDPVFRMEETDSRLSEITPVLYRKNNNVFQNSSHDFDIRFDGGDHSSTLFEIAKDNSVIRVFLKSEFGHHAEHVQPYFDEVKNTLLYTSVKENTDYMFALTNNGVDAKIYLNSNEAFGRHTLKLETENAKLTHEGKPSAITLRSNDSDDLLFEIGNFYLKDASGSYSESVACEIMRKSDSIFELTLIPDHTWLKSVERQFPITLHWAMNEPIGDQFIAFPKNKISADKKLNVDASGVPFSMKLPPLRENEITKKVTLQIPFESIQGAKEGSEVLYLNRVTASNEKETIGAYRLTNDAMLATFDVTGEYTAPENTTYELELASDNGNAQNAAIAVMNLDSSVAVYSVESTTDEAEEEDSQPNGESGNIGSFGTYNVDLKTGKLNMDFKAFAWEGNRMPVNISFAYKGLHAGEIYSIWKSTNTVFNNMRIGFGWHMNLMQSLVKSGSNYIYTDETDTATTLKCVEVENGEYCIYKDEDENYSYSEMNQTLTKGDETHIFENGRLKSITDKYQNTFSLGYDTNDRLSSVTDGVGRRFVFAYDNNNHLTSITAPNQSAINFTYQTHYLTSITYPNGQKIEFSYGSSGSMPTAITVSGSVIKTQTTKITYQGGKVHEIALRHESKNTNDRSTTFDYAANQKQTMVTEREPSVNGTHPEIVLHKVYLQDSPEHNYTYYEMGDDGKINLNSEPAILPYSDVGTLIGNMKCENLLKNHNFHQNRSTNEINLAHWETNIVSSLGYVDYDNPEGMPGCCAVNLNSFRTGYEGLGIYQDVMLENGSYVFSCYLKNMISIEKTTDGIYLCVTNLSTGETKKTTPIVDKSLGYVRAVVPFEVNEETCCCFRVGIYVNGQSMGNAVAPQLEKCSALSPYNYIAKEDNRVMIYGAADEKSYRLVSTVYVRSTTDAKETFTLSANIRGRVMASNNMGTSEATLGAHIYYLESNEPEVHNIPFYATGNDTTVYTKLMFSKNEYKGIEKIEVIVENNYNNQGVEFSDIQLIRSAFVEGLSEEDFAGGNNSSTSEESDSKLTSTSSDNEVETIQAFEEALDAYGNAITGTNFKNGELGTIYSRFEYADTANNDEYNDEGNNKTLEIDARGNETKYEYDSVTSKPTKVTDRCGNATAYEYDDFGRTTKVTAPNNGTVSYAYNNYDDLTGITRGDGQAYTMGYDAYRNLTSVNVGAQNLVTYAYTPGGNRLKSMTYANGAVQNLTYDRYGNVIGEVWKNGTATEAQYRYFYDVSNQLVKTLDITNKKLYNITRVGDNVTAIEEYNVTLNGETVTAKTLVGTMHYSFDANGKQFRKNYVAADGTEQKYVFEYQDEQNVAVQLPTGVVSHAKSDHFGRKVFDELQLGKGLMNRTFTYHKGVISEAHEANDKKVSNPETTLVKQIEFADGRTIQYEYDAEERITKVIDSVDGTYEYEYDSLGQLKTEKSGNTKVNEMTYDDYGNILTKNGVIYVYDTTWKDKLIKVGTQSITYDDNGNPTNYMGTTLEWEKGRQLKAFGSNTYKYNNEGIRISKTVDGVTHKYTLDGTNIVKETWGSNTLIPYYDLDGTVCGLKYNGTAYYFYKNLQGDVIAITDDSGATVARYTYDAWGKVLSVKNSDGTEIPQDEPHIANINPFRYRSYYYDTEIEMYYLQSRYYDPSVGRFINADDSCIVRYSSSPLNTNLFSIGNNNMVSGYDIGGYWGITDLLSIIDEIFNFISSIVNTATADSNKDYRNLSKQIKELKGKKGTRSKRRQFIKQQKKLLDADLGTGLGLVIKIIGWIVCVLPYIEFFITWGKDSILFLRLLVSVIIDTLISLFCNAAKWLSKLIPFAGFLVGWGISWLLGRILNSFFSDHKKEKIAIYYNNNWRSLTSVSALLNSFSEAIKV